MKRALAFFLALLVLCFVLPAAGEPAGEDADTLRAFLQEHYGLSVRMGSECYDYALMDYEFKITPEGNTPFQKLLAGNDRFAPLLRLLDDAFSVYPPEFFSRFRTSKSTGIRSTTSCTMRWRSGSSRRTNVPLINGAP